MLPKEGRGEGADYGWAVAKNEPSKAEDLVHAQEDVAVLHVFTVCDGHAGEEARNPCNPRSQIT